MAHFEEQKLSKFQKLCKLDKKFDKLLVITLSLLHFSSFSQFFQDLKPYATDNSKLLTNQCFPTMWKFPCSSSHKTVWFEHKNTHIYLFDFQGLILISYVMDVDGDMRVDHSDVTASARK